MTKTESVRIEKTLWQKIRRQAAKKNRTTKAQLEYFLETADWKG